MEGLLTDRTKAEAASRGMVLIRVRREDRCAADVLTLSATFIRTSALARERCVVVVPNRDLAVEHAAREHRTVRLAVRVMVMLFNGARTRCCVALDVEKERPFGAFLTGDQCNDGRCWFRVIGQHRFYPKFNISCARIADGLCQ